MTAGPPRPVRHASFPDARPGLRPGAARGGTAAGLLAAALVALLPAAAAALELPTSLQRSRYGEARGVLMARGWRAAPTSADPSRCAPDFAALCATYPETEYCAGAGLARCVFLWRDGEDALIELRTLGRDDPVVEIVRCRSGCRARRLERDAPRLVRALGRPT